METKRILVVDDYYENLDAAKEQLQQHDLTVALNFDEAIALMHGGNYEVVMSDLYLENEEIRISSQNPSISRRAGALYVPRDDSPKKVPLGFSIALYAALKGASAVAVVSSAGHHATALTASFDFISNGLDDGRTDIPPANFRLNGARALFSGAPAHYGPGQHLIRAWDKVLESLLKDE